MKRLLTLAACAALLTGCGAAAEASQPAAVVKPHKLQTAVPLVDEGTAAHDLQEDEAGWDCLTNGNRICGANPIERTEAWGAFRVDTLPEEVVREAFKVTYRGVAMEGVDFPPSHYVTIPSQLSDKVHVFEIEGAK